MKKFFLPLLLLPFFLSGYAPLVPKGRATLDVSYSYFDTDHFYDKEGHSLYSYNDFQRHYLNALFEMGITDRDNLSLKGDYACIHDRLNGDLYEGNEAELGWKRALYTWDDAIFAAEVIAVIPVNSEYEPEVRYGRWGAEGALLYAQTFFPCFGNYRPKVTLDGRLGYRWYSGFPSDQIRSDLTAWVDLSCRWQVLASSMVEYGLDNGTEPKNISFFFYNAKYRVWKGKLEAIFYINNRLALSAGYMHHFMGERIAVGGEWYGKLLFCF